MELSSLSEIRKKASEELLSETRKFPITKILQTCPGLGPIRVAELVLIVVTSERFRTKRHLWSYSGMGVVTQSSSD